MDPRPDPSFTLIGHADDLVVRTLRQALSYKGFSVQHEEGEDLILRGTTLALYGFWPIVGYLDERYPHPPLFPECATERAVVRSITNELLRTPDPVFSLLRKNNDGARFSLGKRLTLADLVVYAYLEAEEDIHHHKLPQPLHELRLFLGREIAAPWQTKRTA